MLTNSLRRSSPCNAGPRILQNGIWHSGILRSTFCIETLALCALHSALRFRILQLRLRHSALETLALCTLHSRIGTQNSALESLAFVTLHSALRTLHSGIRHNHHHNRALQNRKLSPFLKEEMHRKSGNYRNRDFVRFLDSYIPGVFSPAPKPRIWLAISGMSKLEAAFCYRKGVLAAAAGC